MRQPTEIPRPDIRLPDRLEDSDLFLDDPITIFEIENFLPPRLYAGLSRTFPEGAFFGHRYELGGKWFCNNQHPEFREFIARYPAWYALYAWFSSADTLGQLKRLVDPFIQHRPEEERRTWVYPAPPGSPGPRPEGDRTLVRQGFELSALLKGDSIPPHTDLPKKLVSLMIYFPDPDLPALDSCGTTFYRAKPGGETRVDWDPKMMTEAESADFLAGHEPYFRSAFTPNKLVGFLKSAISWHAVPPLDLPPGRARKSINLNIYLR